MTWQPLPTILELAQQAGFRTGNVTTAELTDATPAVLDSHVSLARLPGPGRHGDVPDRDEGRPAVSARSPSRRSTTTSTCSWAAARQRFDQAITGGPSPADA